MIETATAPAAPAGNETVTLSKTEYEALLERLEDLEDIAAARKTEHDQRWPHEIVVRLMSGTEPPLRILRAHRGMTQAALAEKTGLKQGYISELESGRKAGSPQALRALARALDADVDDLIPLEDPTTEP